MPGARDVKHFLFFRVDWCFITVLSILLGWGWSCNFVLLTVLSCFLAKGLTPDEEEDSHAGVQDLFTLVCGIWIIGLDGFQDWIHTWQDANRCRKSCAIGDGRVVGGQQSWVLAVFFLGQDGGVFCSHSYI